MVYIQVYHRVIQQLHASPRGGWVSQGVSHEGFVLAGLGLSLVTHTSPRILLGFLPICSQLFSWAHISYFSLKTLVFHSAACLLSLINSL